MPKPPAKRRPRVLEFVMWTSFIVFLEISPDAGEYRSLGMQIGTARSTSVERGLVVISLHLEIAIEIRSTTKCLQLVPISNEVGRII